MRQPLRQLRLVPASLLVLVAGMSAGIAGEGAPVANNPRQRQCFDAGWSFFKGDAEGAERRGFDASGWRRLDLLPHDSSIEGPYDARNPNSRR